MAALLVHCGKRPGSPETSRFRSPAQQLNVKNGDWFPSRRRDRNSDNLSLDQVDHLPVGFIGGDDRLVIPSI
jgi:hypothetical protein